jgi:hypothetical protein
MRLLFGAWVGNHERRGERADPRANLQTSAAGGRQLANSPAWEITSSANSANPANTANPANSASSALYNSCL